MLFVAGPSIAEAAVASTAPRTTAGIDADSDPDSPSSPVYAIVEANGRFYIGGDFQTVAGESQPYLAAIDVATGRLDQTWRPQVNGPVHSIAVAPDGSAVYVGGKFFKINSSYPSRLAKLDPVTGAVDNTFDPDPNAVVEAIVTDGTTVWVGGVFTNIGGVDQLHIAKMDSAGTVDTAFDPVLDGNVLDLELVGSRLYAGGNFTTIDAVEHLRIASFDAMSGVADAWAPVSNFKVYDTSIKPDGSILYAAGAGSLGAGGNSLTAWDTTTGELLWRRVNSGDFQAVVATDELVYIGTHGEYVYIDNAGPFLEDDDNPNAVRRNKLAAFDPTTGALDAWNPGANSIWGVWALSTGPSGLAVGGDFTTIGGVVQPHFAIFDGPEVGNKSPIPEFTYNCVATTCSFGAQNSVDPDGSIVSYAWDFGDGQTATGPTTTVSLTGATTVSLTVTDNGGVTARTQNPVIVNTNNSLPAEIVGVTSYNGQDDLPVTPTALMREGDFAVAIVSIADPNVTITAPTGWTSLGSVVSGSLISEAFTKPLVAADLTEWVFTTNGVQFLKGDVTMAVFRNVDLANPVQAIASTDETSLWAQHTAPAVTTTAPATVAHFWANRSGNLGQITPPGNEPTVSQRVGLGGAHINSAMSLAAAPTPGVSPARVAIGNLSTRSAIGWSIAITQDLTPPECVATLNADGTITVDWEDVQNARSYTIRRNGSWLTTLNGIGTTNYIDTPGEGTYTYEVRAPLNGGGRFDMACSPTITIDAPPPPPPPAGQTCTATVNADGSISLAWDPIVGENGYSVRRNGSFLTFAGNSFSYNDTPGEGTWEYIIRSKMGGVTTNTSCGAPIDITTPPPPPPAGQTCTATVNADGSISLVWDEIPGEDTYIVRRNGGWLSNTGALTYDDTSAQAGDTYVIRSRQGATVTNTNCV